MTQCGNRIYKKHTWSHVAHNLANAHPELRRIAMYLTFPAARFPLTFRAFIHTCHDIIHEHTAIIAQALAAMLPPAIMRNHLRHYPLFTLNPLHPYILFLSFTKLPAKIPNVSNMAKGIILLR